jgi:hypothetical protein
VIKNTYKYACACQIDMIVFDYQNNERKQMTTLSIGQEFVTQKSGVKGTIKEIVQNPSGSVRLRLDVRGKDRWTTVKPEFKIDAVKL